MERLSTWYVVLNGSRARILRGLPPPHETARAEISLRSTQRTLREHLADRPARTHSPAGGGRRTAVEPASDPLREDTRRFLLEVFDFLEQERRAGAFERLVVVGGPDVVGLWRETVPHSLSDVVDHQIIRNLVRLSAHELVVALRALETPAD